MRMRTIAILLGLTLLALTGPGCTALPAPSQRVADPETFAQVADEALAEISGIAPSRRLPGVYWVLNDSGDLPRIFALDATGRTVAEVRLDNATARDWEDIASFTHHGEPWLLIADVGDNGSERTDTRIHLLPEPDIDPHRPRRMLHVSAPVQVDLSYEGGPRDCEGVAVSPATGEILLISKRTEPPVLYSLPLELDPTPAPLSRTARRITPLAGIEPPTAAERTLPGRLGQYRAQVTAFDISPDGRSAAVLTYGNIWLYSRRAGDSWADALTRLPERVPVVGLLQAEALCFEADNAGLVITTEGQNPPLQRYHFEQP